jgi:hypothetical protein
MTRTRKPLGRGPGSTGASFGGGADTEVTGSTVLLDAACAVVAGASAEGAAEAVGSVVTGLGDSARGSEEQARRRAQDETIEGSFIDTPAGAA